MLTMPFIYVPDDVPDEPLRRGTALAQGLRRLCPIAVLFGLLVVSTGTLRAQPTERLMLSGQGIEDAVLWDFFCTDGRRSGEWTQIPVPSHWEQHGFGTYNYGHDDDASREQGMYRHDFTVPESWQGLRIELVFEGVMTDAEVEVNGSSAGPVHRGAFYPFRYEIGPLLRFGEDNTLQVTVRKHSTDKKVNLAERDADYWIFGGIFRPVYLEAKPRESIRRWAIDARHEGAMDVDVFLHPPEVAAELEWQVTDLEGIPQMQPRRVPLAAGAERVRLTGDVSGVKPWSAETPHLYRLQLRLLRGDTPLHVAAGRFGFRTFEVRPREGLFVNGRRVRLKGVNRHVFWPTSGRATWPRRDRLDVETLKALNLNAVRTAHYPPDKAFLEACDAQGLYVLNELGGWHDAYGSELGRQLVEEMVTRDVNHPSILFWNNGNEGGWNVALDDEFGRWDPQGRPVLHPDERLGHLETRHYPHRQELLEMLDDATWLDRGWGWRAVEPPLIMPTEMLHGLYDGGSGAGLASYWQLLRDSPRGVGAFLWSFTDESIERTDQGGALDSDGNHAPDGVLGPYREWSGTADAVRRVFSPIVVEAPSMAAADGGQLDGTLVVHNRFDHLSLAHSRFAWQLVSLPTAQDLSGELPRVLAWGEVPGPPVDAGMQGRLSLLSEGLRRHVPDADALRLTAFDPAGRPVMTWMWPLRNLYFGAPPEALEATVELPVKPVEATRDGDLLRLSSGAFGAEIDLRNGALHALTQGEQRLPLQGPWPLTASSGDGFKDPDRLAVGDQGAVRHYATTASHVVEAVGPGVIQRLRWSMRADGWLRLSYLYEHSGKTPYRGIDFPLQPERVLGLRWLGHGPSRIWGNRRQGPNLGLWSKARQGQTEPHWGHEPKLDGYYAGIRWAAVEMRLENGDVGELQVAFEEPGLDLGILTPAFPEDAEEARAEVAHSGLSFLNAVPDIGTKFHPAKDLSPPPTQLGHGGLERGVFWLRWRPRS